MAKIRSVIRCMVLISIIRMIYHDFHNGLINFLSILQKQCHHNAYGEAAFLDPGHAKQIGKGNEGVIYIDDFEGTRSSIDLRFPLISWTMASTPQKAAMQMEIFYSPKHSLIIILLMVITVQNLPGIILNRYCRK